MERLDVDPLARVSAVRAFPVKSLDAQEAAVITVDAGGVVGDRRFAVVTADGAVVTAEAAPVLRTVVAAPGPQVTLPGEAPVGGAAADEGLTRLLGRAVRVVPVAVGSVLDAPVHLVSLQAMQAAARGEHDAADCACSLQEPRANVVLDLADPAAREETWVGRDVCVGDAVLRLHTRPGHCLGVYAEVLRPGRIRPGDVVTLTGR